MLVSSNEKVPIARLLRFLEHGERLAHDCAKAQVSLAWESGQRRFLLSQARQETAHALVFQGVVAWLAPRHLGDCPFLPAMEEYRQILRSAIDRDDFLETVLAEQVILEGLGEAILTRIERGLVKRGASFTRVRRVLLHQEEAHHWFGRRTLERAMADGRVDREMLRHRAKGYLALTDQMVFSLSDLFHSLAEDPRAWARDVRTFLPEWLREEPIADD